jgi:protein-tyrosine phosphatase
MTPPHDRHIRLTGAFNVRDLGGYATATGGTTRWRSFLRADALHELSEADIDALLALGLRTVIDLRSNAEIARQPSALSGHAAIDFHHIALFDGLAPVDAMMMETGAFDLSARYVDAVERCRPAIVRVATTIAEAEDGLVLFNCTAGKDRTGIVAAMLLALAGVETDEIVNDYALTASIAGPLMAKLRTHAMARGLDEATSTRLLSSEPAAMLAFLRHMDDRHGGFDAYLARETDAEDRLGRIRSRIVDVAASA